jgi:hypothetical protein
VKKAHVLTTVLIATVIGLGLPGCGGGTPSADSPESFKNNLEESIKAAERGKELVKAPGKKGR